MADPYCQDQERMDREYVNAYDDWIASMTDEELERAKELGVVGPDVRRKVLDQRGDDDASGMAVEEMDRIVLTHDTTDHSSLEAIRQIIAVMVAAQNIRLQTIALAFASGLSICHLWGSQSRAAREHGWSRQHLNKAVKAWQDLLDLPPNPYTSSEQKCSVLSRVQKAKHWRNSTFTQQHA